MGYPLIYRDYMCQQANVSAREYSPLGADLLGTPSYRLFKKSCPTGQKRSCCVATIEAGFFLKSLQSKLKQIGLFSGKNRKFLPYSSTFPHIESDRPHGRPLPETRSDEKECSRTTSPSSETTPFEMGQKIRPAARMVPWLQGQKKVTASHKRV